MKAWKFLCEFEDNLKQFTSRPSKIVLDIGSNDCQNFFFLFNFHGFEKYIGIDKLCKSQIFDNCSFNLNEIEQCYSKDYQPKEDNELILNSFFNVYKKISSRFSKLKVQLDENKFKKHFSFIKKEIDENTNFQHFIEESNDLIILSDFLHLFNNKSQAKSIFDNSISTLKDIGFVYLTLLTKEYAQERIKNGSLNIKWGIKRSEVELFINPLNIFLIDESDNRINLLCGKNDKA